MQRNIKLGDRIYYEYFGGGIGSAIVTGIRPETTTDINGKEFSFNRLFTGPHTCIEDYNTLAPSNPKVKAYIKEMKTKREALINEALMFAYPDRKGLFKHKDKEPYPYDNTRGFVHSSWLNQFRKESDCDFIENLVRLFEGIKEMTKKEEE